MKDEDRVNMMYKALQKACDQLRSGTTDMPMEVILYKDLEDYFITKTMKEEFNED